MMQELFESFMFNFHPVSLWETIQSDLKKQRLIKFKTATF